MAETSPLEQVEGVELCVPFPVVVSRDRGPAVWIFPLVLPTTCHSHLHQAADKGFLEIGGREMEPSGGFTTPVLVAGMPITGVRKITDLAKGVFLIGGAQTFRCLLSKLVYGRSQLLAFSEI